MDGTKAHPKYLIIDAQNPDRNQNVSIKLPLGILHFAMKLVGLLPSKVKDSIDKQISEKGVNFSLDELISEGYETLINTLREVQIDVDSDNHKCKLTVE